MIRFSNWPTILDAFLLRNSSRAFRYGAWDCCLFVADAVQEMTGVDLAASFRGQYSSAREAMAEVAFRYGRPSVAAVSASIAAENGLPEIEPSKAMRGDMVLLKRGRDYSLGLVSLTGADVVIAGGPRLLKVSLSKAVRAWHV